MSQTGDGTQNTLSFFDGSFGKHLLVTFAKEGYSKEYVRDFIAKEIADDNPTRDESERALMRKVLGIDLALKQDFMSKTRFKGAFMALLDHRKLTESNARYMRDYFWDRIPNIDPAPVVDDVIRRFQLLDPYAGEGLEMNRVFWNSHGMGYIPGNIYPFYARNDSYTYIHKAACLTLIASEALEAAHFIYSWVAQGSSLFDAVYECLVCDPYVSASGWENFWKGLGFATDESGFPLLP